MAKPKRKNNKRTTLNNHSSKAVHPEKQKGRPNATANGQAPQSKVLYWLDIAYKTLRCVEFFLKYLPSDFW